MLINPFKAEIHSVSFIVFLGRSYYKIPRSPYPFYNLKTKILCQFFGPLLCRYFGKYRMNKPVTLKTEKGHDVESTEPQAKVTVRLFHEAVPVDLSEVIRHRRPRDLAHLFAPFLTHNSSAPLQLSGLMISSLNVMSPLVATPSLEAVAVGASKRAQNSKVWQRISRITHWEQERSILSQPIRNRTIAR